MAKTVRFGVSLDEGLLKKFDKAVKKELYANRSEAIRDLIREKLVRGEWTEDVEVTGCITLVYDHHHKELLHSLMDLQHDYHQLIVSSQHIHLDTHNCFEVIIVKGRSSKIEKLAGLIKSCKGVKHSTLNMATKGDNLS